MESNTPYSHLEHFQNTFRNLKTCRGANNSVVQTGTDAQKELIHNGDIM